MTSFESADSNYSIFRECLSSAIVEKSNVHRPTKTPKRKAHKSVGRRNVKEDDLELSQQISTIPLPVRTDPEELADFTDFLASEIFTSLPRDLQTISYSLVQHTPTLSDRYTSSVPTQTLLDTLPVSVADSLSVYGLIPDVSDVPDFLARVITEYVVGVTKPPPMWATTRSSACEICERDWIPLSYHHLIPRGVHAKVLKKGWHDKWMLNSVAWLCRACHSFVHRMASNEELAREWYTVDRIMEREDAQDWAKWVSRVRWKAQ
ncbi:hypothetical protein EYZ11_002181 [Aspergillus tanneri]|uniref:HNH domain-containing protein n=1 Tax=Aspergillus tanneri TaxID=1220188 RepID=A0A4S3JS56_9EURO|nr:uncharacterized protein ATNIH1004_008969 [Aspergillus tanneri]KAA8644761.1 hypothetical protein ATNIH1004_008969 [Aspergillus tanneri]THC98320.1 hypothetical protein EYZ11_002181 [Aspergillus tanneri]